MTDIVAAYKDRMQTAPDKGLPGNEWDVVNDLIAHPPHNFDSILRWILAEHKGYVEPRARAGLKFIERNRAEGLTVIEQLIRSDEPDDRDTALTVLEQYGQSSVLHLARPLLQDPYPYLRLAATQLLAGIFLRTSRPSCENSRNTRQKTGCANQRRSN